MKILRRHPDDRAIAALAVPALGALTADPLYSLIDTALVGHLGAAQLGGVAVGSAAFTASFWIFSFLAYGVTSMVARSLGAGNIRDATDKGAQALGLALIAGVIVALVGALLTAPIISAMGGEGMVESFGIDYLRIRALSAPFMLIALVGHGWLRGAQDTRTPMTIAITGAVLNAGLDWVLIYPAGMGVSGAAWATVLSQGVVAAWFLKVLLSRFEAPRWRLERTLVKPLLSVGAELVVRTGALLAALTFTTSMAARMGTVELAAWQIAMQIFLLLSLTMDAIAIAAQSLIATAFGAEDRAAARRTGNRLLELGLGLGIVLGIALWIGSAPLAGLFTDDEAVRLTATRLLHFLALSQPVGALAFTLDGILIGALETRFMAKAMLIASVVFTACSYVAFVSESGTTGLAFGAGLWLLARAILTWARYRHVIKSGSG